MMQKGIINKQYIVDSIEVTIEQDRENTIDVLRPTSVEIGTNAPNKSEVETWLFNEIADKEYNNADGSGHYREEAANDVSKLTGVSVSSIEIV